MANVNEISKIGDSLMNANYNKAIIIKALTTELKVRTLTILFDADDAWNDCNDQYTIREYLHTQCIQAVIKDNTILGYQTFFCNVNSDMSLVKTSQYEPQATNAFRTS